MCQSATIGRCCENKNSDSLNYVLLIKLTAEDIEIAHSGTEYECINLAHYLLLCIFEEVKACMEFVHQEELQHT